MDKYPIANLSPSQLQQLKALEQELNIDNPSPEKILIAYSKK